MSAPRRSPWPVITGIALVFCLVIALPDAWKPWAPAFLKPELKLGLDLAGGTQLDFRISEDEINERIGTLKSEIAALENSGSADALAAKRVELQSTQQQRDRLVEAIRTVLERRINALGVSEATITPSYYGEEKHLLVECPGIIDVERCIKTVGKTIRLEFKEEFSGDPAAYEKDVRSRIASVRAEIARGTSLQVIGQDMSSTLGVAYSDMRPVFVSDLPKALAPLARRTPKDPVFIAETKEQATIQDANGEPTLQEIRGVYLAQVVSDRMPMERPLTDPRQAFDVLSQSLPDATTTSENSLPLAKAPADIRDKLQTMEIGSTVSQSFTDGKSAIIYLAGRTDGEETMKASHILVQYAGAERAPGTVKRTREEAKAKAEELRARLAKGESFDTLARTESDAESKASGGSLGAIRRGQMTPAFEAAAFALPSQGISSVVETPFGFHIIRADTAPSRPAPTVTYDLLRFRGLEKEAADVIARIEKGDVKRTEDVIGIRSLFFSLIPTGWQDTPLNGQRFRSASVGFDNIGTPLVQIQFDEEGGKLFQEMTKRNIGKRIAIFVGGDLVSAPTVQGEISGGNAVITGSRTVAEAQALAQDLNTGAIPAPIFLSGQTTIEATLGDSALHASIIAALVGFVVLCIFMLGIYRLLGFVACIALVLYAVILIAAMKLPILLVTSEHVVLTLAGIAGIVLSIGMAVDANVLVFERIKEEMQRGKSFRVAIDIGFSKAWPSIRDGNASTLITCAILFMIGTSIIRGFSVTLTIGLLLSLFTAIVISRWLAHRLASSPLSERMELFGVRKSKE